MDVVADTDEEDLPCADDDVEPEADADHPVPPSGAATTMDETADGEMGAAEVQDPEPMDVHEGEERSASVGTGEIELGADDEVAATQAAMQVEPVANDDESEAPAPAPAQRKRGSLHKSKPAGSSQHNKPRASLHKASKQSRVVESSESPPADPAPEEAEGLAETADGAPAEEVAKTPKRRLSKSLLGGGSGASGSRSLSKTTEKKKEKQQAAAEPATAKKKSKVKDPDAPKKNLSAYMLFCKEERRRDEYDDVRKNVGEMGKRLGAAWQALDDKEPWAEAATADKERYAREMADYVPSEPALAKTPPAKKQKVDKPAGKGKGKAVAAKPAAKPAAKAAAKPRAASRLKKATFEADDDSSEEEGDACSPAGRRPPARLNPMAEAPLLTDASVQCVPRARRRMRSLALKAGDEIAWSPQALRLLETASPLALEQLAIADMPHAESDLVLKPADGTMNAARVLAVDSVDGPEGWAVLRLEAIAIDGSDIDGAEKYSLPFADRAHCDADQHVVRLGHYRDSVSAQLDHVVVRFAGSASEEELWEGRVWDRAPLDPGSYPNSRFKEQRVLWYVQQVTPPGARATWLLDNEQTDTEVSPWECEQSDHHAQWKRRNGRLAALSHVRVDRSSLTELVAAPDSIALDEDVCTDDSTSQQEVITRVVKRLLSNEATPFFLQQPPESEKEYYGATVSPICLTTIEARQKAGEYDGWAAFEKDVQLLCNNSLSEPNTPRAPSSVHAL